MSSALWIGTTGLTASSKQLEVIGDNLANANTVGFKAGDTCFASLLSRSVSGTSGNNMQVGQGVGVAAITTQFAQGSFETTSNSTDLAIDGQGFFVVKDDDGATYYTRAGAFNLNKDGYLSDMSGYRVQGLMYDSAGNKLPGVSDINLLDTNSRPKTTSSFNLGMNLNADAEVGEIFSTTQTVYGPSGSSASLNITFEKTASDTWDISAELEAADGTIYSAALDASGLDSLVFTADGQLINGDLTADPVVDPLDAIFSFADAGSPLASLTWNLTDNAPAITAYAMSSRVNYASNDGYPPGSLDSLNISGDGTVFGYFTNGESRNMAQILLADFIDPTGLQKEGSYFVETSASGSPILSEPGGSGLGSLQSNALEVSNTDMAREFIKMISAQRAYQANSRVITTADEMLTELMNIKR